MHEFPEVQAMVAEAVKRAGGADIKRLTIVVGEASGHSTYHIQEHFFEASQGTLAEGAALEFVHEPLSARCAACGADFSRKDLTLACAQCGGSELVITAGNNVRLAAVKTA